jgi:hypothetical protein
MYFNVSRLQMLRSALLYSTSMMVPSDSIPGTMDADNGESAKLSTWV